MGFVNDHSNKYNPWGWWRISESLEAELRRQGITSEESRRAWLTKHGYDRSCSCCRTLLATAPAHQICDRCKDHVACINCANDFIPGPGTKGTLCQDPECEREFAESMKELLATRAGSARRYEFFRTRFFFKKCPYRQESGFRRRR